MNDQLAISLFQTNPVWQDADANISRLNRFIDQVPENTDLVILPEMFLTGFSMDVVHTSQKMNGTGVDWMRSVAKNKNLFLAGSLTIEENGSFFNRMLVASPNDRMEWYDKRHLFRMGEEQHHFSAGDSMLITKINDWNVMPLVCYDLRFPVWSRNCKLKYDLLIYVANWPEPRRDAFLALLKARAIENQSYVIGVNRVGVDGNGLAYSGDSVVVDPKGIFLNELSGEERIINCSISLQSLRKFRDKFPAYLDGDDFELK